MAPATIWLASAEITVVKNGLVAAPHAAATAVAYAADHH